MSDVTEIQINRAMLNCPTWCVVNHKYELSTPMDDLVLHESAEIAAGVRIARTDCPEEGRVGKAVVHLDDDIDLEDMTQARALIFGILTGMGQIEQ